ncbi:GLPGLI family protein [Aquimarina algicola]|uniref:GLPGLI family protein n=1 Tax=Aquimarina algicola TaxID=2589995 RepID=A0A504JNB9_9FLAO|nr:GLPGLI family protein [Aquimarina algicola]TPN87910.1 GLPGLI family protein [Aquimarina algicola]
MKNIILILSLIFIKQTIYCQKDVVGIVDYQNIIHNENGVSFANPYKLYFNNTISFYEKIGNPQKITSKVSEEVREGVTTISEDKVMESNTPMNYYYTNSSANELLFRETIVDKLYEVKDSIESISWELHAEHKKIGEYNCQKATAQYRGRKYTVWFTTKIPVSHGPWKLRGLPGLILEATEETGKFEFRAIKIDIQPDDKMVQKKLSKPVVDKITDMTTYKKVLKNKFEETRAKIQSSLPRGAKFMTDCDVCPDPNNFNLERFK